MANDSVVTYQYVGSGSTVSRGMSVAGRTAIGLVCLVGTAAAFVGAYALLGFGVTKLTVIASVVHGLAIFMLFQSIYTAFQVIRNVINIRGGTVQSLRRAGVSVVYEKALVAKPPAASKVFLGLVSPLLSVLGVVAAFGSLSVVAHTIAVGGDISTIFAYAPYVLGAVAAVGLFFAIVGCCVASHINKKYFDMSKYIANVDIHEPTEAVGVLTPAHEVAAHLTAAKKGAVKARVFGIDRASEGNVCLRGEKGELVSPLQTRGSCSGNSKNKYVMNVSPKPFISSSKSAMEGNIETSSVPQKKVSFCGSDESASEVEIVASNDNKAKVATKAPSPKPASPVPAAPIVPPAPVAAPTIPAAPIVPPAPAAPAAPIVPPAPAAPAAPIVPPAPPMPAPSAPAVPPAPPMPSSLKKANDAPKAKPVLKPVSVSEASKKAEKSVESSVEEPDVSCLSVGAKLALFERK